jgi:carboxyl-terminal processing protease
MSDQTLSSPAADEPPSRPHESAPLEPALQPAAPRFAGSPVPWVISLVLAAMVGTLLFVAGYLAAGAIKAEGSCAAPNAAFAAFCEAYDKLKSQYVDKLDDSALAEGAIKGMFEFGVKDPFSGYMSPEDYQNALGSLSGQFSGIGAEMAVRNAKDPTDLTSCAEISDTCELVVVAPLAGSPAEDAGLLTGDIVLKVDAVSVNGTTLADQVAKVRGPAGTDVTLTLRRGERTFDLKITRRQITSSEVATKMLDNKIGYIALRSFSPASADQFHTSLKKLLDQGATSIIFDLRDDPGGYIDAANRIASEFIGSGLIFTQESSGGEVKRWEAVSGGLATDPSLPLVVLVNNGSASASEIVSAALLERGRATLIGQHTYGKNTVQVWTELENHGGVRITISRWFTPDHHSVAPDGVQPQIVVTVPAGTPPERDLYIERAVEELNEGTIGAPSPSATGSPAAYEWLAAAA